MRHLILVMLAIGILPLAGCWWMIGEEQQTAIRQEYDPDLEIRNPNVGRYYHVEKVLDGNTIVVSGYDRPVQLLGVAAPGHSKNWNDFHTKDAYLYLRRLLLDKEVTLYDDMFDELPFRRWRGKVLAYVYLHGRQVNIHLIERGHARVEEDHTFNHKPEFYKAQERARRKRVGLWAAYP
jgi:endonuclease YncB( thermonuclease family)